MSPDNTIIEKLAASDVTAIRDLALDSEPLTIVKVAVPGLKEEIPLAALFKGIGEGHTLVDLSMEADKWRDAPLRRTGVAKALTVRSLIDLIERHKDAHSAIFADILDEVTPSITAVIDYHMTEDADHEPRFLQHKIHYAFPISKEWREWQARSAKELTQAQFADWLEDHLHELVSADTSETSTIGDTMGLTVGTPRDIMQLSRGLQIHVASKVANLVRPQDGTGSVLFEEEHQDGNGKPLKIPGAFIVQIPLFFGGDPIRVPVRLRYRKEGAAILWTFVLHRAREIVYEALKEALNTVEVETGLPVYEGSHER